MGHMLASACSAPGQAGGCSHLRDWRQLHLGVAVRVGPLRIGLFVRGAVSGALQAAELGRDIIL